RAPRAGRRDMVEEAAMLVIGNDKESATPLRRRDERVVDTPDHLLAERDVRRGVIVIRLARGRDVHEVRLDEGHLGQGSARRPGEEAVPWIIERDNMRIVEAVAVEEPQEGEVLLVVDPFNSALAQQVEERRQCEKTEDRAVRREVLELGDPAADEQA